MTLRRDAPSDCSKTARVRSKTSELWNHDACDRVELYLVAQRQPQRLPKWMDRMTYSIDSGSNHIEQEDQGRKDIVSAQRISSQPGNTYVTRLSLCD